MFLCIENNQEDIWTRYHEFQHVSKTENILDRQTSALTYGKGKLNGLMVDDKLNQNNNATKMVKKEASFM